MISAQEINIQSLEKRKLAIEYQVNAELLTELENVKDLLIIGVPMCQIDLKRNKISLMLDSIVKLIIN
jgi:hypothetical protein